MVFQMTPKPHKKIPKLVPEASKRHPKLSLLPPQNTLWAPHVDEPEKNTKTVPKQTPNGNPKNNENHSLQKVAFNNDAKKVPN